MLKIRGLGMKYTGTAGILYDRLKSEILVADGAFGTYYAKKYDTGSLPELANLQASDRVLAIHKEYIEELIHLQVIPCVLERDLMR